MDYWIIISRTIIFYIVLILIMRLMGKREVGELSIFDIIVFFIISELLSISIENTDKSIFYTIVPIAIITTLQLFTSLICYKSNFIRTIIEGKPDMLIIDGKIITKNMRKQRYNLDDLLNQLHERDIKTPGEVKFAILESSGRLTVFKYENCNLKWPLPIIKDGKIEQDVMDRLKYTHGQLLNELRDYQISDVKEVLLCFVLDNGLSIQTF